MFNLSLFASNRYWVDGTGAWNNQSHWSAISGGPNGATIPTSNDDVFFDGNSFSDPKQTVMLTEDGACHNLDWSAINKQVIFSSSSAKKLYVSGSYTLSSLLINGFKGETVFNSTSLNNSITSAGVTIIGNWVFDGTGSWILNDDLNGKLSTIKHLKGTLNTNDKNIVCDNFYGNSSSTKVLNLGHSEITVKNIWDLSSATNLTLNALSSRIIFEESVDQNNFKSGNLSYGSVSAMASCSGNPCASFTITLTQDSVTCQGLCDGAAHAVITGGSGNFTYDWAGVATPTGDGTPNITAMCTGSVSIKVTDNVLGTFCICFITVREPDQLIVYELSTTPPLCNGQCNGKSKVAFAGGTTPISFLWTGGLGTKDSAVNVCAGTYDVTATDWHGCIATTTIVVSEPNVLVAPGVSTMVTCKGFNDGTATVNPSGGTLGYTYVWTGPAPLTGQGTPSLTNMKPGVYSVTVTDANGCTAIYNTTITEPAILTLAVSKVNATCGGLCNGSITATVSGGTIPYTYVWSNGTTVTSPLTTNTISGLCAGSYTITVNDANGCTQTISPITITEPLVLTASAAGVNTSCFGMCNGTGTLTITGGTPIYNIVWAPVPPVGQGTINISGLCPGTYTANITDANLCTTSASVTITEPPVLVANPSATNPLCFGVCNGTATANPTGGTAPYTYSWTGPAPFPVTTTQSISNLCPGTYTVKVTDSKGCISTQSVTIPPPTVIVPNAIGTNITCNGAANGSATANPSGGTGPYTYSWTGPAPFPVTASQTISNLQPGVYTVTVTDANGCTKTQSVTITQPNILNVTLNATVLACNGDCTAAITATVSGGTPPYSGIWSTGNVGFSITNRCAGTYTITVTDANGCSKVATITVNQPTVLTAVSSSSDVTCFGLCNGSASVIAGGGTPGYTYLWLPGNQTTATITNQCAGTYTIRVRDLNGCTVTNTVVINEPAQLTVSPSIASAITCAGACNGSLTATYAGGNPPYTSNWLPGNYTGEPAATITNICAGTYTIAGTDSKGCTASSPITITQPTAVTASITGSTSSCNICNGTATVTPAGGTAPYSFQWSVNAGSQITQTATGLCPNVTYTVTVTDSKNCIAISTVTISQTIAITITTSNTTLSCVGACDGIATANAAGGAAPYAFQWNNVTIGSVFVSDSQTVTNLCAGTYEVIVRDVNGCLNKDSVTFTNPPVLSVTTSNTNLTCGGTCTGTATANPLGGTGAYTYLWSPGGQTTQTAVGLCLGTYTITVTDSSGCTVTDSAMFTQPTVIIDNPTFVDANCTMSNGSISVAPTGGTPATVGPAYTYLWSGPVGFVGQGTSSITNLIAGAYDLTITDSVGCQFNFSYLISNINGPNLSMAHTDISCNNLCDGTATITASAGTPGYTYDWTPNATGDGTNSITGLCGTTTYTVMVTDNAGCISFDSATVINPLIISPNQVVVNESCGGSCNGTITLNPSGGTPGVTGYTYSWSGGLPATATQSNLCAGSYTVIITDSKGCTISVTIVITSPPLLTVTLSSTNVKCTNACNGTATATPSGGSGAGYTYTWSPSVGILANVVNLCPGQYIVTLKDGNNCIAKDTVVITEPLPLLSSTSQTNASCFGVCDGVASVSASGGTVPYSYNWMPGAISNDTASALCAGNHDVTVTDANGCISTPSTVIITEPAPILANATFTNAKCNGSCDGTATAAATGGSGVYSYSWNTSPVQNTATATGLCAGTYIVTVDDGNCTATQNVTLVDPPVLIANPSSTSPTCRNDCDGSVTAIPVGGTPGYTYSWSPGAIPTQTVNNLCPSVYTVIVTDLNLCKDTQSVTLINPSSIDIAAPGSTPAACGASDGTISITPITGQAPYTYVWTIGGVAPPAPFTGNGTANVTNVAAGLYSVTVTDFKGCDSTFLIPLNNASGPTGETVTTVDVTCNGLCNGSGTVVPIGGVPPYDYLWNSPNADTTPTAIGLCAGSYLVEVTDSNSCIHFSPVTINQPNPINSGASITRALCSNICTGAITLIPTGGTPPFSNYVWSPGNPTGQNTSAVSNLCSGTYTVTYNDANLCPKVDSFIVTQSTPLNATIASTNISCSSSCNGIAYVTISSGTAPFTIQWDDASGQTNDTAISLCAGTYSAKITDALSCITILTTTITSAPPVVANVTVTNATCGVCDGAAIAAPTGGTAPFTYVWSNGQTVDSATNLCSGLYTLNITDSAGCVSNFGITVSNANGPTSLAITSTNVTCNGLCNGAVTATTPTGGTAPYTYLWIQGGQTTPTLSNLCADTYYVQVTDTNGCSIVDSVVITEPAAISANQVITAASCGLCDGSITVNPSCPGYTLLWNTGASTPTLNNLCAGVYSVQITCPSGCTQNVVIPLNSQNGPTLVVTSTNVTCNGACNGTATAVDVSTGTSSFLWNDVSLQTTATATSLCPGNYFVQGTDINGCISVAPVTITEPTLIGFSVTNAIDPLCNGDSTGSISVIPSGGTLPYSFAWTPAPALGQTTSTASGLNANTYNVTVTDANGCAGAPQTITLTQTAVLAFSPPPFITNPSCNTLADGAIDISVTGGALPYTYQWSGGSSATTEDLTNILAGSDTILVTDNNGCTISDTILVVPNQTVIASAGNDTSFCQSGALTISAAASVGGVNYEWFDMSGTSLGTSVTLSFNPPTGTNSYYVTVDNGAGCIDSDTIIVTSNTLPVANAGADVIIVVGGSTTIGGSPTGPAGSTYTWLPLPGLDNSTFANPVANPSSTTNYTVSVSTTQGCISTDVVTVTVLPTIIIPDGISPNADGDNDEWLLDGIELFPNCTVEVYNRWGELLFQSKGYKEHWKGVFKGKPLPVGTYYYIIDLKDPLFPDAYTGPITILR